jgi:hypothetical protein
MVIALRQYFIEDFSISNRFPPLVPVYAQPLRRKDTDEDALNL